MHIHTCIYNSLSETCLSQGLQFMKMIHNAVKLGENNNNNNNSSNNFLKIIIIFQHSKS